MPVHWGISIQLWNAIQFSFCFMLYRRKKSAILQVQIPCYSRLRLHFTYCGMIHCITLKWISCMVKKTDCSWSLQSVTAYMQIQVFVDLSFFNAIHITYFMDKTPVFLCIAHNAHILYVISISSIFNHLSVTSMLRDCYKAWRDSCLLLQYIIPNQFIFAF